MKQMQSNSVDAIVTDPPYGISFMAKKWDYDVPSVEVWKEAMRVLKHGGHALIACGTRTQHRMVVNIEDAGFEIRDVVSWIYGSGFPKSLNIHKKDERCPDGWGTALKPACEFFTLCRKPLSEKTIAANVLKWGTGGINIDGCRVEAGGDNLNGGAYGDNKRQRDEYSSTDSEGSPPLSRLNRGSGEFRQPVGRFPANLIHDGSPEVLELFPETKPKDSAARFFYCPKASKKDRNEGLEGFEEKMHQSGMGGAMPKDDEGKDRDRFKASSRNHHPTVKPTALMAYLCRLITPTGGVVLDPYMGSGSTGKAAMSEGFRFTGIELDKDYFDIATARVNNELKAL
jgi:site-specific DNA-methyltransferase (adenine-specific)